MGPAWYKLTVLKSPLGQSVVEALSKKTKGRQGLPCLRMKLSRRPGVVSTVCAGLPRCTRWLESRHCLSCVTSHTMVLLAVASPRARRGTAWLGRGAQGQRPPCSCSTPSWSRVCINSHPHARPDLAPSLQRGTWQACVIHGVRNRARLGNVATGNGCRGLQSVSRSYVQSRGELGGLASHGRGGRTMKCFGGLWATKSPQRLHP